MNTNVLDTSNRRRSVILGVDHRPGTNRALLEVDRVSREHPGSKRRPPLPARRGLSLTADPGKFISIVGPSVCGKSAR